MNSYFGVALVIAVLPLIARSDVTVINQPQPVAIVSRDRAVFSVLASGSGSLGYQWRKNGADIAGDYSVRLNDETPGTRTSEIATLSVRPAADGDVDFSFGGSPGVIGTPTALSVQSDGRILVCNVEAVGRVKCGNVVRLNGDGTIDATFCNVPAEIDGPKCVVQMGNGRVFVAGSRWGIRANGLQGMARLNRDGSVDGSFANGLAGVDGDVKTAVLQADGKIIIGGDFTTVHGVPCGHVARLNGDGTLDTSFCNGLAGTDQEVNAIALQPDGKMVIGGSFTDVHGVGRAHVARLNSDGTLDAGFASTSTGTNGAVNMLLIQDSGKIVIGGMFSSVAGIARSGIARLQSGGALDGDFAPILTTELAPGVFAPGYATVMAQAGGDEIVVAGAFSYVNGVPLIGCARLNSYGTVNAAIPNQVPYIRVTALAVQADGKVLTGGQFWNSFGYVRRQNIDGTPDEAFTLNPPLASGHKLIEDYAINGVATLADGRLLIAGESSGVTRLKADGRVDPTFATGPAGPNGAVRTVAVQRDGRVLMGGNFSTVHGLSRHGVARLNEDGTVDASFADPAVAGYSAAVSVLAVQNDGKIIIAGSFLSVGGVARGRIARLNSNGTLDVGFGEGLAGFDGEVYSLALQPDGKVIVGGHFSSINGLHRDSLARLNSDGSLDAAFGIGFGTHAVRWTTGAGLCDIRLQADGKVLVAGYFDEILGEGCTGIVRLDADGSLDGGFVARLPLESNVTAIAVQGDGRILISGGFGQVRDGYLNGIVRLLSDGTLDPAFDGIAGRPPPSTYWHANGMALEGDGKVIIVGGFISVNDIPRGNIVRLYASSAPGEINVEQPAGAALVDSGAGVGFGNAEVGGSSVRNFKITNQGAAPLTLGPFVKDGVGAAEFALNTTETSLLLAPGASTSFEVVFTPFSAGAKSAALHIGSNDADESPFDIPLAATGTAAGTPALTSRMLSPAPGTTLGPGAVTFTWSAGAGVSGYALWIGRTPGGYDL